jgi:uncharacterized glyoxalase superfamily protein PhnB
MTEFYPTLVSEKFAPTINFYEDFFGFVPSVEQEGYVLMQSQDNPSMRIGLFDKTHDCVSPLAATSKGFIVNIVVEDVKSKFDHLYMEGVEMYKEFGKDVNGRDHFVVFDPNGILINVHAPFGLA